MEVKLSEWFEVNTETRSTLSTGHEQISNAMLPNVRWWARGTLVVLLLTLQRIELSFLVLIFHLFEARVVFDFCTVIIE